MKIDKIISASLVATLSCGFAGAFSANAVYTETQAIERFNDVKGGYGIGDLDGNVVLSAVKVALGVKEYDGLLGLIDEEGNIQISDTQKQDLKDLLEGNGYTVKREAEGMYSIYKGSKKVIPAEDLKNELKKLKTESPAELPNNNNNNNSGGFITSGESSSLTSTSTSTGSTSSNTKVDYGDVGKDNKNKIVQDSGVYKFVSEKAGVTSVQKGRTEVVFKPTIEDALAKGMSLVTIAVEGTGKDYDDDTKTIWALDVKSVNKDKIGELFDTKVVVSKGTDIVNGQSETGSNLLSAAKINAIQDSAIATDAGAAAELKTDINKEGTKVVDFGKADGDALPCAAAVRVNIADTDKKIKIKVYYICNSRCYKLGNFETDSKGNVVCNFKAGSQIGDFVFVPVK